MKQKRTSAAQTFKEQSHKCKYLHIFYLFRPACIFAFFLLYCCLTSTEARWPIRDGDRVGRGRQSEGSTAETARKRPERPWTAARTMEVLRRCPLAIAQRLVHCAIAVSTAVLGQSHKDKVRCTAVDEQLGQLEVKEVQLPQSSSTSLLPPLRSLDLLILPGTLLYIFALTEFPLNMQFASSTC